ncbi:MAG: response regulator [Oscillospiraceae bacterium]|nr:response regulator [Oscillospiraceae bacterium]
MIPARKQLLVVDDSELDREILKSILEKEFEIVEANNGYSAVKMLQSGILKFNALLLDLQMPILDGFAVLSILSQNHLNNIPVFIITSEPTKQNIERAAQFGVSHFIMKPFDSDAVISRLKSVLKMEVVNDDYSDLAEITESDMAETDRYIKKLKSIYNRFLEYNNIDSGKYERMESVMEIVMKRYMSITNDHNLTPSRIKIICKAAYFYDLGMTVMPGNLLKSGPQNPRDNAIYKNHTICGSDLMMMNDNFSCQFFVKCGSEMCMHHHERWDGRGFPHNLKENENTPYTQLLSIAIAFDDAFMKHNEFSDRYFDLIISELTSAKKQMLYSPAMMEVFRSARSSIVTYYQKKYDQ